MDQRWEIYYFKKSKKLITTRNTRELLTLYSRLGQRLCITK
jgi:hypothetical protein